MEKDGEVIRLQQDLTLTLLYLNSWQEKSFGEPVYRSWKGHDFDTLDSLVEQNKLYGGTKGNKSIYLTPEGIEQAKSLVDELLKQRNGLNSAV